MNATLLRPALRAALVLPMLMACATAGAACGIDSIRQELGARPAGMVPPSDGLPGAPALPGFVEASLGAPAADELTLETVLLRQRLAGCIIDEFAGYQPRTRFDNTPWRFNAGGEGRKFSAAEFDAWMKKRGIRVAKGRQDGETRADAAPAASALGQ